MGRRHSSRTFHVPRTKPSIRLWIRGAATVAVALACLGCEAVNLPPPRVAFPWQGIADVAGPSPHVPLAAPAMPLHGERGRAALPYPTSFAVVIRPDGSISFPQHTSAKLRGASVVAGSTILATLDDAGNVTGAGLKRRYAFNEKGDLVDDTGRGVRLAPDGRVRGLGGSVRYTEVMAWVPETRGERWDYVGWRTLSILSLLVLENLMPETVGLTTTTNANVTQPPPAPPRRSRER